MKTFTYKDYKNCYFIVGSYIRNNMAMEIRIENAEGAIMDCTIYDDSFFYTPSIAAIKNYSENSHITEFLIKLGIVKEIINRIPCNFYVLDTLKTDNPQTIDFCFIDNDKLKEYCKSWNYNV